MFHALENTENSGRKFVECWDRLKLTTTDNKKKSLENDLDVCVILTFKLPQCSNEFSFIWKVLIKNKNMLHVHYINSKNNWKKNPSRLFKLLSKHLNILFFGNTHTKLFFTWTGFSSLICTICWTIVNMIFLWKISPIMYHELNQLDISYTWS